MRPPGALLFDPPILWTSSRNSSIGSVLYLELERRDQRTVRDLVRFNDLIIHLPETRDLWFEELYYVRALRKVSSWESEVLELFGLLLCQGLAVPRDCIRDLSYYESHSLVSFTNACTLQVYCWHSIQERDIIQEYVKLFCRSPPLTGVIWAGGLASILQTFCTFADSDLLAVSSNATSNSKSPGGAGISKGKHTSRLRRRSYDGHFRILPGSVSSRTG